jgi:putative CocE/NonD family hydrolase
MQDCRGSGLSTGESNFFLEARDGRACGDWIAGQPWFDGRLGTFGASYMSFTQWAFASTRPPYLSAMAIATLGTERGAAWYPGGSFALDIALPWTATMVHGLDAIQPQNQASVEAAFAHLPLEDADRVAVGQTVKWYQDWLRYPGKDDPHWKPIDYTNALDLGIPTLLVDGWYDYAVSLVIRDHRILRANGTPARLVVGPWTHFSASEVMFDETVRWFDRFVKGDEAIDTRGPVNVFVMPDVGWRELPEWPPAVDVQRWYLQPDAALALARPPVSDPTPYVYDPSDPTPQFGGPSLRMEHCGPVDNRELEARGDVLTFTSPPFADAYEVVGPVVAELHLQSDVDHFDVYLRLCDVLPDGASINLCDGIRRLGPGDIERGDDGAFAVTVEMWPTAQRFGAGHRMRLQVSGGAHPLFARNTCSGEPLGSAKTLVVAHNAVRHDPDHPSAIVIPHLTETNRQATEASVGG